MLAERACKTKPDKALRLTIIPLRGLSAAELQR